MNRRAAGDPQAPPGRPPNSASRQSARRNQVNYPAGTGGGGAVGGGWGGGTAWGREDGVGEAGTGGGTWGRRAGRTAPPLRTSPLRLPLAACPGHRADPPEDLGVALGRSHMQGSGPRARLPHVHDPATVEPLAGVLQHLLLLLPPRLLEIQPCGGTPDSCSAAATWLACLRADSWQQLCHRPGCSANLLCIRRATPPGRGRSAKTNSTDGRPAKAGTVLLPLIKNVKTGGLLLCNACKRTRQSFHT